MNNVGYEPLPFKLHLKVVGANQTVVQVAFDLRLHDLNSVLNCFQIVLYRHVAEGFALQLLNNRLDALERRDHLVRDICRHQTQHVVFLSKHDVLSHYAYVFPHQNLALLSVKDKRLNTELDDRS